MSNYTFKSLIIFDLDQTLAESKSAVDEEMAQLLGTLLESKYVAVISGGKFSQFEKQLLSNLTLDENMLQKLVLLPTSGTAMYTYDRGWNEVYKEELPETERRKIIKSIKKAIEESGVEIPEKHWGSRIEDRGSQITFSALGQEAPAKEKKVWDPDLEKRKLIKSKLTPLLPQYNILIGGSSSLDITKKGMDKAYGVKKLSQQLNISIEKMLFVGDRLLEGGNDYPVVKTGIETVTVNGPRQAKQLIRELIN